MAGAGASKELSFSEVCEFCEVLPLLLDDSLSLQVSLADPESHKTKSSFAGNLEVMAMLPSKLVILPS